MFRLTDFASRGIFVHRSALKRPSEEPMVPLATLD